MTRWFRFLTTLTALVAVTLTLGAAAARADDTIFDYTGANQTYTVPNGITHVFVRLWGAGGAGGEYGGGGAFVSGYLAVMPGQKLTVLVGGGGKIGYRGGFGGGGQGYARGGGRSALIAASSTELVDAGGGGGGGRGGAGGVTQGQAGGNANPVPGGGGGTQTAGGAGYNEGKAGGPFQGGDSGGGGGGGGYYGGGGSGYNLLTNSESGGGGGSSYTVNLTGQNNQDGNDAVPGGNGDPFYSGNVGAGGDYGDGGNGRVVISLLPPTANAGADQTVTVPHDGNPITNTVQISFNGAASTAPYGAPLAYQWTNSGHLIYSGSQFIGVLSAGTYTFTLTVTDTVTNLSASDDVTVTVNPEPNRAPIANAGQSQTVTTTGDSASVTLNGGGSTDPDGATDPLTYSWTEGATPLATAANPTVTLNVGVHTLTLTVTDPYGATGTATVKVTVQRTNVAPILNAIADQSVIVGQTLTFAPTLAQSGNNAPLTYSLVGAPAGASINPATGQVTWTPSVAGVFTFSVMVTDNAGLSDSKPVKVTVASDPNGTTRLAVTNFVAARVNPNTVTVTFSLTNAGTAALQNVQVTRGKLGSVSAQTPLPGQFTIGAGNKQTVTLTFTNPNGIASGSQPFTMGGTYQNSAGATLSFSSGFNLAVPQ